MTPENVKFCFQVASVFVIVAGICFLMLALPDFIGSLKTIFSEFKKKGG